MAIHIRRRELLVALGGAAACPVVAKAQQPAMPVIGYLGAESPTAFASRVRAFRQPSAKPDMSRVEMSQ